jgi:hypothetical protein
MFYRLRIQRITNNLIRKIIKYIFKQMSKIKFIFINIIYFLCLTLSLSNANSSNIKDLYEFELGYYYDNFNNILDDKFSEVVISHNEIYNSDFYDFYNTDYSYFLNDKVFYKDFYFNNILRNNYCNDLPQEVLNDLQLQCN